MEKGQKVILDYPNFQHTSERPVLKLSSACSDNQECTVINCIDSNFNQGCTVIDCIDSNFNH